MSAAAIEMFDRFIVDHVDPELHGHFLDTDNNQAEQIREAIRRLDHNTDEVPAATDARIRNAERHRLAYLLEQDGDSIVRYLSDPRDAVRLVAYLLRLEAQRSANRLAGEVSP